MLVTNIYKFNEYPVLRTEQDLFKSFNLCENGKFPEYSGYLKKHMVLTQI